jgi:hypothetical protein
LNKQLEIFVIRADKEGIGVLDDPLPVRVLKGRWKSRVQPKSLLALLIVLVRSVSPIDPTACICQMRMQDQRLDFSRVPSFGIPIREDIRRFLGRRGQEIGVIDGKRIIGKEHGSWNVRSSQTFRFLSALVGGEVTERGSVTVM